MHFILERTALLIALGTVCALPYQLAADRPFSPGVGQKESEAVSMDNPEIVGWADGVAAVQWGDNLDEIWKTPQNAIGPASGLPDHGVVSLGEGGSITLYFDPPISANPGWDFAVFGNAFNDFFLELATVSVSSNGDDFHTFPHTSLTSDPVGAFGLIDPRRVDGFAGKFRSGFGTPFDLNELQDRNGLDIHRITHVRIDDVIGDGRQNDSHGNPIYDPYPTVGSAGFDLDAIAVRDPVRRAFSEFHNAGFGWRWATKFGYMFTARYPWIYFGEGQWLLYMGGNKMSLYFLHNEAGWVWTNADYFPYVYRMGTFDWALIREL